MINVFAATSMAVVFSLTSTFAGGLDDCAGVDSGLGAEREHRDFGGGIVSYRALEIGREFSIQRLVVEACASGEFVHAVFEHLRHDPDSGATIVHVEATEATFAVLEQAVDSSEGVTLSMLKESLSDAGAFSEHLVSLQESCACHLAYPRLRGSKEEFDRIR